MKKYLIFGLLFISIILTGCIFEKNSNKNTNNPIVFANQTEKQPVNSGASDQNQYRKVAIAGDLVLTPDPPAGYKGLVMTPSGTVNMTFWFPADGGEAIKQSSAIALTSYEGIAIGGAAPCVCTIDSLAMEPRSFTFKTLLTPNANTYTDANTNQITEQLDGVDFYFDSVPTVEPINFTCQCTGAPGTQSDYGAAYTGLLAPFAYTHYRVYIKSDGVKDVSEFKDSPIKYDALPLPYLLNMDLTTTEEWVNSLD